KAKVGGRQGLGPGRFFPRWGRAALPQGVPRPARPACQGDPQDEPDARPPKRRGSRGAVAVVHDLSPSLRIPPCRIPRTRWPTANTLSRCSSLQDEGGRVLDWLSSGRRLQSPGDVWLASANDAGVHVGRAVAAPPGGRTATPSNAVRPPSA